MSLLIYILKFTFKSIKVTRLFIFNLLKNEYEHQSSLKLDKQYCSVLLLNNQWISIG